MQSCITADETLLPNVVDSLITINQKTLAKFMQKAQPGKFLHRIKPKGKTSKTQGILILCIHPEMVDIN